MTILAIGNFLLGAVLARFFKVWILIAAFFFRGRLRQLLTSRLHRSFDMPASRLFVRPVFRAYSWPMAASQKSREPWHSSPPPNCAAPATFLNSQYRQVHA